MKISNSAGNTFGMDFQMSCILILFRRLPIDRFLVCAASFSKTRCPFLRLTSHASGSIGDWKLIQLLLSFRSTAVKMACDHQKTGNRFDRKIWCRHRIRIWCRIWQSVQDQSRQFFGRFRQHRLIPSVLHLAVHCVYPLTLAANSFYA